MNLKNCLEKGYLVKEIVSGDLISKEFNESDYDLASAKKAIDEEDHKWAIIKCYYSMFHAAKAICFSLGYREKKHVALLIMLEELNKQGKLENEYITYFKAAIDSREGADYQYTYSQEIAQHNLKIATLFNSRLKKLKI